MDYQGTGHSCRLVVEKLRIFGGKCKKHRLRHRDCNLKIIRQGFIEKNSTFSSWWSRFSLWHSIVISPSSSLICLLLLFLPLLACRWWNAGESGAEFDEVGQFKSSSQYTTLDGIIILHYNVPLLVSKLYFLSFHSAQQESLQVASRLSTPTAHAAIT